MVFIIHGSLEERVDIVGLMGGKKGTIILWRIDLDCNAGRAFFEEILLLILLAFAFLIFVLVISASL